MSYWNYRIIKEWDEKFSRYIYYLGEVYYNDAGKPIGCTVDSISFETDLAESDEEAIEGIKQNLEWALQGANKNIFKSPPDGGWATYGLNWDDNEEF